MMYSDLIMISFIVYGDDYMLVVRRCKRFESSRNHGRNR